MKRSTAIIFAAVTASAVFAVPLADAEARAKSAGREYRCAMYSASGTGVSAKIAKFQAYEGLLKSADTSLWAAWMASGTTPGYAVKNLKYHCATGTGLGASCVGRARFCKL